MPVAESPYPGVAERAAHNLLVDWLTPEQLESYVRNGSFEVVGGESGRTYLINGCLPNYCTSYEGMAFCFTPSGTMPFPDRLLGMKLGLEHNEGEALRVANWRDVCDPPRI